MFGFLQMTDRKAYNPAPFCYSLKDFEGNPTNTGLQQDAQEFLNIFFDKLETILKENNHQDILQNIFQGQQVSQLKCKSCGHTKNVLDSYYNLSIPVKDRTTVKDSLSKLILGETISDYECQACNKRVDLLKRSLIGTTPNVLILHL